MNDINTWLTQVLSQLKIPHGKPQDIILEKGLIASCQHCEKEFGISQYDIIQSGYQISHKTCIRHLPRMIALMFGTNEPQYSQLVQKYVTQAIQRVNTNGWKTEPRDLARSENKEILQWLKHPAPVAAAA